MIVNDASTEGDHARVERLAGPAVLASYGRGAATYAPEAVAKLWGGVLVWIQPYYSSWMFVAAAGYLVLLWFLFFAVDAERARVAGRWGSACSTRCCF
jgi:hypothetical protein